MSLVAASMRHRAAEMSVRRPKRKSAGAHRVIAAASAAVQRVRLTRAEPAPLTPPRRDAASMIYLLIKLLNQLPRLRQRGFALMQLQVGAQDPLCTRC
jgi:hypothetical protein